MDASGVPASGQLRVLVSVFVSLPQSLLEVPDPLPDTPGDLGNALGPEEQDHQGEDKEGLTDSEAHELPALLSGEKKIPAGASPFRAPAGIIKMAISPSLEKASIGRPIKPYFSRIFAMVWSCMLEVPS
jgi:hypothetical protein